MARIGWAIRPTKKSVAPKFFKQKFCRWMNWRNWAESNKDQKISHRGSDGENNVQRCVKNTAMIDGNSSLGCFATFVEFEPSVDWPYLVLSDGDFVISNFS